MSLLHDPNFMTFDGTPVTGRAPASTTVVKGELTRAQRGLAAKAFTDFKVGVKLSITPFVQKTVTLSDGSRMRMTSNNGTDQVLIWPVSTVVSEYPIPHGLAVLTDWGAPLIYKFRSGVWIFDKEYGVPQAGVADAEITGYNQIIRSGEGGLVLPLVYVAGKQTLWDYAPHSAPSVKGAYSVPFNLEYPVVDQLVFDAHGPHLLIDYTVRDLEGVTLYEMQKPEPLLLDPEPVVALAGNSNGTGTKAVVQAYRQAIISETGGVTAFRFCNETLKRTGKNTYGALQRSTVTLFTPIAPLNSTVVDEVFSSLDADMSESIYSAEFYRFAGVNYDNNESTAPPSDFKSGYAGCEYRFNNLSASAFTTDLAFRKERQTGNLAADDVNNIIALPSEESIESVTLAVAMSYPKTEFWQGGYKTRGLNLGSTLGGSGSWYYGTNSERREYREAKVAIDGTPIVELKLFWTEFRVFDGVVKGRLDGRFRERITTSEKFSDGLYSTDFCVAGPQYTVFMGPSRKGYYTSQTNLAPGWQVEMTGAPSAGTNTVTLLDESLVNTANYNLVSRHILDYDHRANFIASLKVMVDCAGARWVGAPDIYPGAIRLQTEPNYRVRIYFESTWKADTALLLLHDESCVKPPFEFLKIFAPKNVFTYPSENSEEPLFYFDPPQVQLPAEVVAQLATLPIHQGVNAHLAAQGFRNITDLPIPSEEGLELSFLRTHVNGYVEEVPHEKYVQGQLYARTFSLPEVMDALWMLRVLKMDAPLNNFFPEDGSADYWHYLPQLKAALENNVKFHVEVRNGVIGDWSGDIPATMDTSVDPPVLFEVPTRTNRNIRLYQV